MDIPPSNASGVVFPTDCSTLDNASNPQEIHTATENAFKVIGVRAEVNRHAIRIITTSGKGEIILIYVKKGNYYKLPGGGIEESENHRLAGEREVKEETGCKVVLEKYYFAVTEEWRNDLHQI